MASRIRLPILVGFLLVLVALVVFRSTFFIPLPSVSQAALRDGQLVSVYVNSSSIGLVTSVCLLAAGFGLIGYGIGRLHRILA